MREWCPRSPGSRVELGHPTRPSRILDICLFALSLFSYFDGLGAMPDMIWAGNHHSIVRRIASPLLSLPSQTADPVSDLAHDRPPVREQWHLDSMSNAHRTRRLECSVLGVSSS